MKKKYAFSLLILLSVASLAFTRMGRIEISQQTYNGSHMRYAAGPPTGRTGAPMESNCTECHSGSVNNTTTMNILTVKNSQGVTVTSYFPDSVYTVSFTLANAATRRGFQVVALRTSNNAQAGTMTASTPGGTQLNTASGRQYINHVLSSVTSATGWTFQWTAPSTNVGDVRFYAASNLSNGNSSSSGDMIYLSQHTYGGVNPPVPPVANFTQSQTAICVGSSVNYTSTSTGSPTSYNWTFPGGTPATSTLANPTVVYNTPGSYTATLEVSNPQGTDSHTATTATTVSTIPEITGVTSGHRCGTGTVALSATASAGTITWYEEAVGGTPVGTGFDFITPVISDSTDYYVQTTVNSCNSTRVQVIAYVHDNPPVESNALSTQICSGMTTTITANGADSYVWTPGGETTAQIDVSPTATTVYTVTGTDMLHNCSATATITVHVTQPIAVAVSTPTHAICSNENASLQASGAVTYTWEPGNISGATVSVSPDENTTYVVTGISGGCMDTAHIELTVTEAPTATLANFADVCIYTPAFSLTGGAPAGGTYSGNGVNAAQEFNPAAVTPGDVTISYLITEGNCADTAHAVISVSECLGVTEQSADVLVLYPNPNAGQMTIAGADLSQFSTLELRDATGTLVSTWIVEGQEMTLDLTRFEAGNYLLVLQGKKGKLTSKVTLL